MDCLIRSKVLSSCSQRNLARFLPESIAPGQNTLGFMLPYTPLHLLLIQPEADYPDVLIMTSGNQSEEPIAYKDERSSRTVSFPCDGFLMHDRPIEMRTDDSGQSNR